ncbi:MAG: hypothetical protein GWO39_11755, partial [Gammaproteobacteria bacterium]|nr:hypothetical protein [Gammaproteobacteria bacterium]NIY33000.1 hypothetical protein [Gammaproteobacteria bacterium]
VRGRAPFDVYLGYAQGVEVELNGEPMDKGRVYASGVARFQARESQAQ